MKRPECWWCDDDGVPLNKDLGEQVMPGAPTFCGPACEVMWKAEEPIHWHCELYDDAGANVGDGSAHMPVEAAALAWLCAVEPGSVPLEVPADWRFEFTSPFRTTSDGW
jgi:hypothetical protein